MTIEKIVCALAATVLAFCIPGAAASPPRDPDEVVRQALAEAKEIPKQASALAHLAWPTEHGDPEVAAAARHMLVRYGRHGIPSIRGALAWARPADQADVVAALIEARELIEAGIPPGFLAGLEDAVWDGSREARVLAIHELARFRFRPALLPIIDAAVEDPALVPDAVQALGMIGDDRARFWLEQVLLEGSAETRYGAASALARIGGRAKLPLKAAMRSEDQGVRLAAVRALLPLASPDDVSALHEYAYSYPDDDPELVEAVRQSAIALEKAIAQQDGLGSPPQGE